MNTIRAEAEPRPKTVCVAWRYRSQPVQRAAAALSSRLRASERLLAERSHEGARVPLPAIPRTSARSRPSSFLPPMLPTSRALLDPSVPAGRRRRDLLSPSPATGPQTCTIDVLDEDPVLGAGFFRAAGAVTVEGIVAGPAASALPVAAEKAVFRSRVRVEVVGDVAHVPVHPELAELCGGDL